MSSDSPALLLVPNQEILLSGILQNTYDLMIRQDFRMYFCLPIQELRMTHLICTVSSNGSAVLCTNKLKYSELRSHGQVQVRELLISPSMAMMQVLLQYLVKLSSSCWQDKSTLLAGIIWGFFWCKHKQ